jgi:hypothetical protein
MPDVAVSFFDYTCDACGVPVCERQSLMNLALDEEESLLCLPCLAKQQGANPEALLATTKRYILSRDCFKKPWLAFNAYACPLLSVGQCPCQ